MKRILVDVRDDGERIYAIFDDEFYEEFMKYFWRTYCKDGVIKYVYATIKQKHMFMHHAVLGKPQKGMVVDHINRNPLDNRRENLRHTTHRTNNRNKDSYRGGVGRHKKSWMVRMVFNTEEQAVAASSLLETYRLTLEGEE